MWKNKVKLRHFLCKILLATMLLLALSLAVCHAEYRVYTKEFNKKINAMVGALEKQYPNVNKNEIMELLNQENCEENFLEEYNIDLEEDSILLKNERRFHLFLAVWGVLLLLDVGVVLFLFLRFNGKKDKEIEEITRYIEEINRKNYRLHIDEISEDELSILKNELYKTTVMLKEAAENSNLEKKELKKSLSDISHQLKTPLTSILVILDNLIDEEEMPQEVRDGFLRDMKREISNISFLVQNLLKLSRLDTNTVHFAEEEISLLQVVKEAAVKLSMLCDLKDVSIEIAEEQDAHALADFQWQVEAVTNILKNSVEHSYPKTAINVTIETNQIYSQIVIRDYGKGIAAEDLPHIFERFYKGKNSGKDSVGIGLALSKSIVEQAGGKILLDSEPGDGCIFKIRYDVNLS